MLYFSKIAFLLSAVGIASAQVVTVTVTQTVYSAQLPAAPSSVVLEEPVAVITSPAASVLPPAVEEPAAPPLPPDASILPPAPAQTSMPSLVTLTTTVTAFMPQASLPADIPNNPTAIAPIENRERATAVLGQANPPSAQQTPPLGNPAPIEPVDGQRASLQAPNTPSTGFSVGLPAQGVVSPVPAGSPEEAAPAPTPTPTQNLSSMDFPSRLQNELDRRHNCNFQRRRVHDRVFGYQPISDQLHFFFFFFFFFDQEELARLVFLGACIVVHERRTPLCDDFNFHVFRKNIFELATACFLLWKSIHYL
ncbi:hypothetical protein DFJ73DRAFT_768990 [Zopfochytrium polystomum]|nr:hypothetical protein DFJ73DRAFT_768990 [Zopfochytrium polystomum]